jgi:hypothetical protein
MLYSNRLTNQRCCDDPWNPPTSVGPFGVPAPSRALP